MEDQPADSGDLTTEAAETAEATEATATRHRHRMPLRREMAVSREGEDKTAEVAEPIEATEAPALEETAAPRRRRWGSFRRKPKPTEAPSDETAAATEQSIEDEEPKPAARTPVGKSRRNAAPVAEPEPAQETPAEEAPAPEVPADETAPEETEDAAAEKAEAIAGDEGDDEDAATEAVEAEQILIPHRPAGNRLQIAAVAAGVLFVGAAVFAGTMVEPYVANRAMVDTKLDVARTAANAITTLWTYNPDNMGTLPDRSARYLGGDFANEYRKYIDAIVEPNKQAQVTNITEVKGAAVESITGSEATAIVYTNSVATSPVTKNIPSLRYLSYRLTMQRRDADWKITRMSTITSLDLTPRL